MGNPKLTIGATVSDILKASILRRFETGETIDRKQANEIVETYCLAASANGLKNNTNWTALNAKVLGGRCFNNRPTDTLDTGVIDDIDIAGAYGTAMKETDYPLGNPVIIGEAYKLNGENEYLSLREFLKRYRRNLVDNLYQIWFSVTKKLNTPQDFFLSYFPPNDLTKIRDEMESTDDNGKTWLDRPDFCKVFSHEITHGLLTSDSLEWLEKIASRKLKNLILDNSIVKTAMFYDAKKRVDSVAELVELTKQHAAKNSSDYDNGITTNINRECKYWTSINLGELIVNDLSNLRNHYKQVTKAFSIFKFKDGDFTRLTESEKTTVETALKVGRYDSLEQFRDDALGLKKHPLDTLYKLTCNTVYGDVVSQYFDVGNVIVGNNITAKIRALVWYLEKGLYTHGSITDGGVFNVNNVCYPKNERRKINDNTTQIYRFSERELDRSKNIVLRPLGGYREIRIENDSVLFADKSGEVETLDFQTAKSKIDRLAKQHLINLFDVSVVSKFNFESKGILTSAVFRGQSDYGLFGGKHESFKPGKSESFAMRSYSEKTGLASKFLNAVKDNRYSVERMKVFYKSQIIKVGEYRSKYNSRYKNSVFIIGDSIEFVGLFREFSLSQFTFHTSVQRKSWESEMLRLKNKYGQSYEMFYTLSDRLEYQRMIEEIDNAIVSGYMSFREYRDENYNLERSQHPFFEHYLNERGRLQDIGNMENITSVSHDSFADFDFDDDSEAKIYRMIEQDAHYFRPSIVVDDPDLFDW